MSDVNSARSDHVMSPKIGNHPAVAAFRQSEADKYDDSYFATEYWREDLPGLVGNRGLSYTDPEHRDRFDRLSDVLLAGDVGPVLDAGCGPGLFLEQALLRGVDARGIDISESARRLFRIRTNERWPDRFDVGPLRSLPYRDNSFSRCICLDALEHLVVFDIFDAARELCRIAALDVVCSINLDNPYVFHPTILSKTSWISIFESTGLVGYHDSRTNETNAAMQVTYPEYDFFVFVRK
jgi:SAM-dependent methyltransferase